jgi:hypothetical protein
MQKCEECSWEILCMHSVGVCHATLVIFKIVNDVFWLLYWYMPGNNLVVIYVLIFWGPSEYLLLIVDFVWPLSRCWKQVASSLQKSKFIYSEPVFCWLCYLLSCIHLDYIQRWTTYLFYILCLQTFCLLLIINPFYPGIENLRPPRFVAGF